MAKQDQGKTWQQAGSGDPPLIWKIRYLPLAYGEAEFLTPSQYWHVRDQLLELARENEPAKCSTVDVRPIEDFWEIRDKGGPLGKINLRVFFITLPGRKEIMILGVHKKEDERQLRKSVVVRYTRRKRQYLSSIDTDERG